MRWWWTADGWDDLKVLLGDIKADTKHFLAGPFNYMGSSIRAAASHATLGPKMLFVPLLLFTGPVYNPYGAALAFEAALATGVTATNFLRTGPGSGWTSFRRGRSGLQPTRPDDGTRGQGQPDNRPPDTRRRPRGRGPSSGRPPPRGDEGERDRGRGGDDRGGDDERGRDERDRGRGGDDERGGDEGEEERDGDEGRRGRRPPPRPEEEGRGRGDGEGPDGEGDEAEPVRGTRGRGRTPDTPDTPDAGDTPDTPDIPDTGTPDEGEPDAPRPGGGVPRGDVTAPPPLWEDVDPMFPEEPPPDGPDGLGPHLDF